MTAFKKILTGLFLLIGCSFTHAQESFSPASSLFGHVAVTVLTPAALSDPQSLLFNDIDMQESSSDIDLSQTSTSNRAKMTAGSIRIIGTHSVYSVTLSAKALDIQSNGKRITVSDFTAEPQTSENECRRIKIGGILRLSDQTNNTKEDNDTTLALMVNYN